MMALHSLISGPKTFVVTDKLILSRKTGEWCQRPYPNHPRGCPNYGKKPDCPPEAVWIEDFINIKKDHWFVVETFQIGAYIKDMKKKHPNWSERQCRNPLYWQGSVRKALKLHTKEFITKSDEFLVYTLGPEAMGVNVISTLKKLGVPIQQKPTIQLFKVALVGHPRRRPLWLW